MSTEIATVGGGCFWCLEAVYQQMRGVSLVESGYSGGHVVNPSYEAVCQGTTGHAEVVRIHFDSTQISYRDILEVFLRSTIPPRRIVKAMMSVRSIVQ